MTTVKILAMVGILGMQNIYSQQQPILRLHFDVNKTIIASDVKQGKGVETVVNGVLAENMQARWNGVQEQSYYAYATDQIAQEHQHLSKADEQFKELRSARLKNFAAFLKEHNPALFKQYEQEHRGLLQVVGATGVSIFPSFYKTIQWLDHNYPGRYAIYLRSFGDDIPVIMDTLSKNTPLKFEGAGALRKGKIHINQEDVEVKEFFARQALAHYGIHDDYANWKKHGFQASGGKPVVIDPKDTTTITMFFDDNANDPDKPILNPMTLEGTPLDTNTLMEKGNIVAVNTKDAILDEDYFIKKIQLLRSKAG